MGGGGGEVVFREIIGGGVPPGFKILTLFQTKKKFISHTLLDPHVTLSFCIHLELKRQLRSYTSVFPSKTIPDSWPKWAKSLTVFRPKGCENYTLVREYPSHHLNECMNFKNNLSFKI